MSDLRNALRGLDPDLDVVVRTENEDGECFCGTFYSAEVQYAHDEDETPFFAIDCSPDEEPKS